MTVSGRRLSPERLASALGVPASDRVLFGALPAVSALSPWVVGAWGRPWSPGSHREARAWSRGGAATRPGRAAGTSWSPSQPCSHVDLRRGARGRAPAPVERGRWPLTTGLRGESQAGGRTRRARARGPAGRRRSHCRVGGEGAAGPGIGAGVWETAREGRGLHRRPVCVVAGPHTRRLLAQGRGHLLVRPAPTHGLLLEGLGVDGRVPSLGGGAVTSTAARPSRRRPPGRRCRRRAGSPAG
jgi:hypothetical protein